MARLDLKNGKKVNKSRVSIHEKVKTTYSAFDKDGDTYIQIDTFRKDSRENPETISQTFQLDKENATKTILYLKR